MSANIGKKESRVFDPKAVLKVSKSRKRILKISFEPKKQTTIFLYFYTSLKKEVKSKNKGTF